MRSGPSSILKPSGQYKNTGIKEGLMDILSLYEFVSRHVRRLSEGIGRSIRRGLDLEQSSVGQESSARLSIARGTSGLRYPQGCFHTAFRTRLISVSSGFIIPLGAI